jgi:glycosyltransferase involved in cell wall biosynthesis
MNVSDNTACALYRAVLPWAMCHADLAKEGIQLDISEKLSNQYEYDCYIFHRLVMPYFVPTLADMRFFNRRKIVWDTDDDLLEVPAWNPAREMIGQGKTDMMKACLSYSDHVTLTTDIFKNEYAKAYPTFSDRITVLPNLIDLDAWKFEPCRKQSGPVRVMWSGSMSHQADVDLIGDVVFKLVKKYKDKVHFIFMGLIPSQLRINNETLPDLRNRVVQVGVCELPYYPHNLTLFSPDISMIPVVDCRFNRVKSNIKYLEMTLAGAASVASDLGPYAATIEDSRDGLLCQDAEDWEESLSLLIENPSKVREMHKAARQKVIDNYSWQSPSKQKWMDFFRRLANEKSTEQVRALTAS